MSGTGATGGIAEDKVLQFNGRLTIFGGGVSLLSGSWPNRVFLASAIQFIDNLDNRGLLDAQEGDILIDANRNRFIYGGFNTSPPGLIFIEDPWDDLVGLITAPYSLPDEDDNFLFRLTPNCRLFQHGRVSLGIKEELVEYLSQKANYQLEEEACGTGPTGLANFSINFIGSSGGTQPTEGQTDGIPEDRPFPKEGDEYINPDNGNRFIYQDKTWQQAPCCGPSNILGSSSDNAPTEGQTGGIQGDRPLPRDGDEWVDPTTGDRYIYQDGIWRLVPCCADGVTGLQGLTGAQGEQGAVGLTGIQGLTGAQGDTGAEGELGPVGAQGEAGLTGAPGLTGLIGEEGEAGEVGQEGAQGDQGVQGVKGAQGAQGAQGIQGATGAEGANGDAGAQGAQGVTGLLGATGLQGEQGAQGAQGERGSTGLQGRVGLTGAQGGMGLQGAIGADGDAGAQGAQGDPGMAGPPGEDGATGLQGSQGPTGVLGPCDPLFTIESGTGATGPTISGPVSVSCGDTVRFFSEGNLSFSVQAGSALVNVEPENIISLSGNPNSTLPGGPADPNRSANYLDIDTGFAYIWDTSNVVWTVIRDTFDIYRYGATGSFHQPAEFQSAIAKSKVDKNIIVERQPSTAVIINAITGYIYDVTVPANDDIYSLTILDRSLSGEIAIAGRVIFEWEDTTFEGNVDEETLTKAVVNIHDYGSGTSPDFEDLTNNRTRTPGDRNGTIGSWYIADNRIVRFDFQAPFTAGNWYGISFAF